MITKLTSLVNTTRDTLVNITADTMIDNTAKALNMTTETLFHNTTETLMNITANTARALNITTETLFHNTTETLFDITTNRANDTLPSEVIVTTDALLRQEDRVSPTNVSHPECTVVYKDLEYLPWNNPDNIISLQQAYLVVKIVNGGLIPLLALFGIVSNALCVVVFYRQGLRGRINLLLFSLACQDLVVELYMFVFHFERFYTLASGRIQLYGPVATFVTNNYVNVLYGVTYSSGFISTLIACERCLCVTHPFTAKRILKTTTVAVVVVVSTVLLVGVHFLVTNKYRIGCEYYPRLGLTLTGYYPSPLYLRLKGLVDVLNGAVYGLFLPCLFALTTTIATAITAATLRHAGKWRRDLATEASQQEHKEAALTRMLVAVSCLYIVCSVPNLVVRIAPFFLPGLRLGGRRQNLLMLGVRLLHLGATLNSGLNFIFYCAMGSRFRADLTSLLPACCCSCIRRSNDKASKKGQPPLATELTTVTTIS